MSLIRLRRISKRYDRKQVLRDVFYRLNPGDRTGLLGRNGSGKTTVLKLIPGQEEPSAGELEVADGLRIGYFSQFSELHGEECIQSVPLKVFAHVRDIETDLARVEARAGPCLEGLAPRRDQARSKRSRFITLSHAATKSRTNACCESSQA